MIKQNKELLYVIEWNKESNDILDLKKTHRYLDFFFNFCIYNIQYAFIIMKAIVVHIPKIVLMFMSFLKIS